ncbi:hypothetical protein KSF78_0005020 [Schistosoma japonicum]|nr:hypothetical protein KSF78_0005020 [Schistosoma japonicum]
MKLSILILILMISMVTTQLGPGIVPVGRNSTSGSKRDNSESRSQGGSISEKRSEDSSRHEKNGINTESMFGSSSSRYQYRKQRDFKARGRFRSRGIGRYGVMSSESTNYVIEGMIDRYGRRRPTNSKFKTRGKEKKYSRRINDNRFDIKGGLYERRQHLGIGDYQANGTHISVTFKTKEKSGSSNGTRSGRDSSTHSNSTKSQRTKILECSMNWMEVKMKLMIFMVILMISMVSTQFVPGRNSTSGSKRDTSESRSQGGSISDKRSADSSRHEKNGINTETMFGTSSSRYQFRKERDFNARGKFRSRGIGRYGAMSSESTNYLIEGNIDRYGRRRPTNSKFKTLGKEKKYSRRINDNRFDIKGGLYERRQHVGIGDYQANGTQISLIFKTNERSGSSNGTRSGTDSSTHSNNTQLSQQQMWIAP